MKKLFSLLALLICSNHSAQEIPAWFQQNMEASVGVWIADNSAYQGEQEPFDQYGMEWEWGLGKQSIKGKLYGLVKGKKQGVFWEFRQYWDYSSERGIVVQYAANGTVGIGPMTPENGGETRLQQDFSGPDGKITAHGHRSSLKDGVLITNSFDIRDDGSWVPRRKYFWRRVNSKQ